LSGVVYLKSAKQYEQGEVDAAVDELLTGCGADLLLSGVKKVLIKPNLLMRASPNEAVTAHPVVLKAVINALKKRGVKNILIADSPGSPYTRVVLRSVYSGCGYLELGEIEGVTLNYSSLSSTVSVEGKRIKSAEIINPVLEADFIVNVGKLKTHMVSGMTGAVKNLLGTVPGLRKAELHCRFPERQEFNEMLVDLAQFVKPQLSIVDGILGMEGNGPSGGTPRGFGILAASDNPYHLDRVLAHCIGMTENEAMTVKCSIAAGLAPKDVFEITVSGDTFIFEKPLTDLVKPKGMEPDFSQQAPRFLRKLVKSFTRATSAHPSVERQKCTGCGKCAEICPAHIIAVNDGRAVIQKKGCIRCFCCHEICPARAIAVKSGGFWKL